MDPAPSLSSCDFHSQLTQLAEIKSGYRYCVDNNKVIMCDHRLKTSISHLSQKFSHLKISSPVHTHVSEAMAAKLFFQFLQRHESLVTRTDLPPLNKLINNFRKRLDASAEKRELLDYLSHLVKRNSLSGWLLLPEDVLKLIISYDPKNQLFLRWRILCISTRDLLPLEKLTMTSMFQNACTRSRSSARHIAFMIHTLMKHKRTELAKHFYCEFVTQSNPLLQETFLHHAPSFKINIALKAFICHTPNPGALQGLLQSSPNLKVLSVNLDRLRELCSDAFCEKIAQFTNLSHLSLGAREISETNVLRLCKRLPDLLRLELNTKICLSESVVKPIGDLTRLQSLIISIAHLSSKNFALLCTLPALLNLCLRVVWIDTDFEDPEACASSSIAHLSLNIERTYQRTEHWLQLHEFLASLRSFNFLRTLYLILPYFDEQTAARLVKSRVGFAKLDALSITTKYADNTVHIYQQLMQVAQKLHLSNSLG